MSLTLDSSLFYTLLLLITEVRHHLCSNAPDTVLHKSVITYFNYNLFLKIGQYLIMNKCYSENLFNITIFLE